MRKKRFLLYKTVGNNKLMYITSIEAERKCSIDWEQRRYEVAKEAMGAIISSASYYFCANNNYYEATITPPEYAARNAVQYADALIAELKGVKE